MERGVTIAVATCGDRWWERLAQERAVPSARAQDMPVLHVHLDDGTLADARNRCADLADSEWIIYLDADDQLEAGYVAAMLAAGGDLRAPAVSWVPDAGQRGLPAVGTAPAVPVVPGHAHVRCTAECLRRGGNWIVVGAAVRTEAVRAARWRNLPIYEDYDLWLRLIVGGATVEAVPDAVYRAYVRPDSRNRCQSPLVQRLTVRKIMYDAGVGPEGEGAA